MLICQKITTQTALLFKNKLIQLLDLDSLNSYKYWNPGNSINHDERIRNLTGKGFNAKYLADMCNLSVDEAWTIEQVKVNSLKQRPQIAVADINENTSGRSHKGLSQQ